jgi:hypothetical protein
MQLRQMMMEGRLVKLVKEVELKISLSSGWIWDPIYGLVKWKKANVPRGALLLDAACNALACWQGRQRARGSARSQV